MTNYVSCACNRVPHCLDWGRNGLICYGACYAVAICDPEAAKYGKVLRTLHRHNGRVNVVQWIQSKSGGPETEFISAASDGTAVIWSSKENYCFEITSVINVGEPISICRHLSKYDDGLLMFTGSINGDYRLWQRDQDKQVSCLQTLSFKNKLALEACFSYLPNSKDILLSIAVEDFTIQLFAQQTTCNVPSFIQIQVLIGHEDWVTCLTFINYNNDVFLASGAQDNLIRLWKISLKKDEEENNELKVKKQTFIVNNQEYDLVLESVFNGHDSWIYGLDWHPSIEINGKHVQPMRLLSCSLDKTMIIWEPDKDTGIWSEKVRVGEVGGNSVGFYGCKFGTNGNSILAYGYQGSFHMWRYCEQDSNWLPRATFSGHFGEVVDLCWEPLGRFIISVSTDQTTRCHAPWIEDLQESWHEISRPQVHGHDITCLAVLTPYSFASGAEEKVVRIFTAPMTFKKYLSQIANATDFEDNVADSASVPALGLTNKAVFEGEDIQEDNFRTGSSKGLNFNRPPLEEELIQHTLWPELQKLYGHGYEIFSMAAQHNGTLLATACKSTSYEHAGIILWNTRTWTQADNLLSHQLTVTQIEFSPDDKYLLSVSRDRKWSLFGLKDCSYELLIASSKNNSLHTRIIWCCTWSHDSKYFATGSRDGKIGIWSPDALLTKGIVPMAHLETKISVTALNFAPSFVYGDSYLLAIGFENGFIDIQKCTLSESNCMWKNLITYDSTDAHHLTVKRLRFRPNFEKLGKLQLASCGSDCTIKIHEIDVLSA